MLRLSLLLFVITLAMIPFVHQRALTTERVRRLTNTPEQALNLNPILSDDGRFVVFESTFDLADVGGTSSFHTIRTDVIAETAHYEQIALSRSSSATTNFDGTKVAFASTEDLTGQNFDRNSEIYLSDGATLRQITNTHAESESSRLTEGNFAPSLSSDGRWIVFLSNRNQNSSANLELFRFDCSDETLTQLT